MIYFYSMYIICYEIKRQGLCIFIRLEVPTCGYRLLYIATCLARGAVVHDDNAGIRGRAAHERRSCMTIMQEFAGVLRTSCARSQARVWRTSLLFV